MTTEITKQEVLTQLMSTKYGIEESKLLDTLKATAFRQSNNAAISNEQMIALMIVANQYNLNPFTKEIYAFPDKGGIVPVVGVDGWSRIANEHPQFDGVEFIYSSKTTIPKGGKESPEWIECVIYRKDRKYPCKVREYLDEVYKPGNYESSPWRTHTKRMLRHKALIQGIRVAFGFGGIYDEDEARNIIENNAKREKRRPGVTMQPASQDGYEDILLCVKDELEAAPNFKELKEVFGFHWNENKADPVLQEKIREIYAKYKAIFEGEAEILADIGIEPLETETTENNNV